MDLSFAALIGQQKAKDLLGRALAGRRLAHAFLFRGPDGVGKKKAAELLAARLNCQHPAGLEVCGRCPSCRKFATDNHPDFLHIRPDGQLIKINQVRELKTALTLAPFEGGTRVVLLEDVHTMRREAANSLLKTLEEPPPGNLFVLTADESRPLLSTITSRCQTVPFFGLPADEMGTHLVARLGLSREEALTLCGVAEGSLGRAERLVRLGLLDLRRELVEKLMACRAEEPETVATVFGLAEKAAALKEELADLLLLLRSLFRDLLLLADGLGEQRCINRDLLPLLAANAGRWPAEALFRRLRRIEQSERELRRNCNRALVCEVLFFELI